MELTLQELRKTNEDPNVICLTETFLISGYESFIKIKDFQLATSFCRDKQRGGTCILTKKGISYKELIWIKNLALSKLFEVCGIEIPLYKLIVISIYRIPASDPNIFLNNLDSLLCEIYRKYKSNFKVVIAGDFNINTLQKGRVTDCFQDLCKLHNLNIHINEPTRKQSCIDHVLSNIKDAEAKVLHLFLSDHDTAQLLYFNVKQKPSVSGNCFIYKKDYSPENIVKFKNYLGNLSWHDVYEQSDFNMSFSCFYDFFGLLYNLCFPTKKVKLRRNNTNNSKWISKGLRKSCKTKRWLRYRYYKHKTKCNKMKYLTYSKLLNKIIYNSKKNSNIEYIHNSDNKCKATWSIIKNEVGNLKNDSHITELKIDNTTITNPTDIANAFNHKFIENKSTSSKIKNKYRPSTTISNTMYLMPMTEKDIRAEVLKLNNTNSEGHDGINTKIIKTCINEILAVLTYLINESFSSGIFPEALKLSIVKPLYKKGEKDDVNNYRPITLIPIFSKIFEKCMYKRLLDFCDKYNIINNSQYGFQNGKSTTLAIFNLLNTILNNKNNNFWTTALFFDLSKAFDYVSHDILLKKLESVGVRGIPLQWISSYLSNRKQYVIVNKLVKDEIISYSSTRCENKTGVPQGSILGPLLFILYINDIFEITNHKIILYADDITIIVTTEKRNNNLLTNHEIDINRTIDILIEWLETNNLKINLDKSVFIQFNQSKHIKSNFKLNVNKINEVTNMKFLGVIIDQFLNWKAQIETICNKVNRFAYALSQLKKVTNRKTAVLCYRAYVESALRYGLMLWGNSTDWNRVFVAQKKCIRAICGILPDESCQPIFKELGLMSLPSLYLYEICNFVHQHKYLFAKASDTQNTRVRRNKHKLVLSVIPKTHNYNKSCLGMCVKIYNKIPDEMKELNTTLFKKRLSSWLMDKNVYSVKEYMDLK